MAMNLKRRLRALEQAVVPDGDYCPTCGFDPGGPVEVNVTCGGAEDTGPCPDCGRSPFVIKLEFKNPRGPGEAPIPRRR